jgi:hypothetical protein
MGHAIDPGERALFLKVGWMQSTLCELHAKELHGLEPPMPAPFEPQEADAKQKSAGD